MDFNFILACLGKQTAANELLEQQLAAANRKIEALQVKVRELQPVSEGAEAPQE